MTGLPVYILDKDNAVGAWILNHLKEIGVEARWVPTVADLLSETEVHAPTVCLVAVRPPISLALSLITELTQEPRFAQTAFILMGPMQYKHAAFEAGADDYLITPPDVIELRKRVRLYLDRAELEMRVVAETRITQEIESLGPVTDPQDDPDAPITLLEHAATMTRERNQFETILHSAGPAIALISREGKVEYVNPAWEKLTGIAAEAVVGQVIEWPPSAENGASTDAMARAIHEAAPWSGNVRYKLRSSQPLDVRLTITPAFDVDQDLIGFVMIQSDITEQRAMENLKARFLADAALEMRTPVTNIKMRQYLLRQAPPDQHPMHLQALERETERLSSLVESMLELSRFDAGLVQITTEPVDLNRLVDDAVVHYTSTAQDKGVTLAFKRDELLPPVLADPTQITRVIGIVVENAINHTPEAGHIEIRLGRESWTGGTYATLQVQDSGIGIAPEDLPHLFERFYRSDRARDSGIRGVGLGLAIAYEIMHRHNGDITVESQVNLGSTFTMLIPLEASSP
jgi:two-component system phosphate regulon sensor histidine kinase PhoR